MEIVRVDSLEEARQTRRLRHVIIGAGAGIVKSHIPALALPTTELVAVSDINTTAGRQRAGELQCAFYTDYRQMLAETHPDVAVIITPPFLHASMAIDCLRAGCHVLTEKPMAIQVAEADQMIETAEHCGRLLGVVLQHRFRPEIIAAHKLIQDGRLGRIQRAELTAVWTRPTSYYKMAGWRATWSGEGGGVLTNQASHNLDVLCHLLGSPAHVYAWTRNLLHHIETEDTAHAMLEWADGALGAVHISTAEFDDTERLKIVGTRGYLEINRGKLQTYALDVDMSEYAATSLDPYAVPAGHIYPLVLEPGKGDHVAVYRSFHNAILHGDDFSSDGAQGRMALELANAIIYSSYRHCVVELPLDRQGYAALLDDLQQHRQGV
jgi:UDP-N-acetyl-2-amino-2-deoxyglucuronate dehydrogenase